jgi:murein L,D-transpeptidase YcbB/YkuD
MNIGSCQLQARLNDPGAGCSMRSWLLQHPRLRLGPGIVSLACFLLLVPGFLVGQDAGDTAGLGHPIAEARCPLSAIPACSRFSDEVSRLYPQGLLVPIWISGGALTAQGQAALAALQSADDEGLRPADYDAGTLDSLSQAIGDSSRPGASAGDVDLRLSVGFLHFLEDLHRGRIQPSPFSGVRTDLDLVRGVRDAIAGDSVSRLVNALEPRLVQYQNLRRHLMEYRRLEAEEPFASLPDSGIVRPGGFYGALPELSRRLVVLGDLASDATAESEFIFTGAVVGAVRRFQARHALEPDGVLGPDTFAALNVSFADRSAQIELALERLRELPRLSGQRFLVVNIPAFELYAFDSAGGSGTPSLAMRVITGSALDTRTPLLLEELRYVDFRPDWVVPQSMVLKELLPALRSRPDFLRRRHMDIVGMDDRVLGDTLTPWIRTRLAAGKLRVRQRPGPWNELGLIKFVFPNAQQVYLHGTPWHSVFSRTRRDLSHGCIRVEDPAALALWVLRDQAGWNRAGVDSAMADSVTTRALLDRPLKVLVFYTTAVAVPDGTIRFYPDVYGHDRELQQWLELTDETAPAAR